MTAVAGPRAEPLESSLPGGPDYLFLAAAGLFEGPCGGPLLPTFASRTVSRRGRFPTSPRTRGKPRVSGAEPGVEAGGSPESDPEPVFQRVVAELIGEWTGDDLSVCREALARSSRMPQPFDGRVLATCRRHLDRDLTGPERSRLRQVFRAEVDEGAAREPGTGSASADAAFRPESSTPEAVQRHVDECVRDLRETQLRELREFWRSSIGVPSDYDRPLLASCRERIGRDLTPEERRLLRKRFQAAVEKRYDSTS